MFLNLLDARKTISGDFNFLKTIFTNFIRKLVLRAMLEVACLAGSFEVICYSVKANKYRVVSRDIL